MALKTKRVFNNLGARLQTASEIRFQSFGRRVRRSKNRRPNAMHRRVENRKGFSKSVLAVSKFAVLACALYVSWSVYTRVRDERCGTRTPTAATDGGAKRPSAADERVVRPEQCRKVRTYVRGNPGRVVFCAQ